MHNMHKINFQFRRTNNNNLHRHVSSVNLKAFSTQSQTNFPRALRSVHISLVPHFGLSGLQVIKELFVALLSLSFSCLGLRHTRPG